MKLWKVHFQEIFLIYIKFYEIVKNIYSRDIFSINPFFFNCRSCLLKTHLQYKIKFKRHL